MAFYTNLIAITCIDDKYAIESFITTSLNIQLLSQNNILIDVSENNLYQDQATIISKDRFKQYLDLYNDRSLNNKWYRELSDDVKLILVHKLEWESGLSD